MITVRIWFAPLLILVGSVAVAPGTASTRDRVRSTASGHYGAAVSAD